MAVFFNGVTSVPLPPKLEPFYVLNRETLQWQDPRTAETQWPIVQARRNELLAATDWVTARAYERGEPVPENYRVYRQALRDVTDQADPFNIVWPVLQEI